MQTCTKCNLLLSFDNFYRDIRYKEPIIYQKQCKDCKHFIYKNRYKTQNQVKAKCDYCQKEFYYNSKYHDKPRFCNMKCFGAGKASLNYNISYKHKTQDWVDGFMMGDIHIQKNGRYSWNVKHEEFCDFISSKLADYNPYKTPYKKKVIWSCKTKAHPDIKEERKRWYPNGIKIVPKDVIINRNCLSALYLSDGSISKRGAISIWTLSFTEEENLFLVSKIKELIPIIENIKINYVRRRGNCQSYLYFPRIEAIKFLKFLKKSDVECYKYKFLIRHTGENFHE